MKAIVLAAGRGTRMRPLSDACPKPLLVVRGKRLIEWHLEALARAGVIEVVVNTDWLEERIVDTLGDGSRYGLAIAYSREGRDHGGALETAGGIAKALPLLGDAFWIVSADVWAPDFRFSASAARRFVGSSRLAHLWLVENPSFHPGGDFGIDAQGRVRRDVEPKLTYANLALFKASLFADVAPGTFLPLRPKFEEAIDRGALRGRVWPGTWANLGTPAQLAALQQP